MGGRIADEDVDRVREAVDIVEVVGGFLPLKRSGRSFKTLCPFHSEKTPSFHVFPESQLFKCFGCGKGGTVFHFLMAHEKMEFPEAVRAMADRAGVSIRETGGGESDPKAKEREAVLGALRGAAFHFRANLKSPSAREAREYLEARGIGDAMIDRFHLGYALKEWDGVIRALRGDVRDAHLEAAGLVVQSRGGGLYDRFRDRLIFPICDARGRILGFGGRVLPGARDDAPKYVNTPDSPVYHKSRVLYGLHIARESDLRESGIIVVEGYTDVIHLHQSGVPNVVATCGTALTQDHVRILKRYTNRVSLVFDGDAAGLAAMDRGLDILLAEDLDFSVVILPEGEDPADFVGKRGGEAFLEQVKKGRDLFDFKLSIVEGREDLSKPGGVARAADEVLSLVAKVAHPVRQEQYIRRTAEALGTSERVLRERLRHGKRGAPVRGPVAP
ncbi:MAG: DNA primase, partial [Planctomycetota bacterium]